MNLMAKYKWLTITTKYWKPGENYLKEIVRNLQGKLADGDYVVISEKAISTALGNIVDENLIKAGLNAKLIAKFWMRIIWGYFLGVTCHFGWKLIHNLRNYPLEFGSRHKQTALMYTGLLNALMFGSEGGIDGSNLPYAYVCLPLTDAHKIAEEIRGQIEVKLGKKVTVLIVDTDKTYSFKNYHFTPRPNPIKGIHSFGGFITYVIGKMLRLKRRATPLAVAGEKMNVEKALEIAEIANRARGFGAGRNVWEMAEKFKVELANVSWEMLETVKHKPIVIVRSKG